MRHSIMSHDLPAPAGPYSHAVRQGNTVVCSGQAGIRVDGTVVDNLQGQVEQCLGNVVIAMKAAGCSETDIVRVNVYLTNPDDFSVMNEVYGTVFSAPYPARTTIYVQLPPGLLIEVDAMAIEQHPSKEMK